MTDIVILVGGRGERLGNLTSQVPKPLIKIKDKRGSIHQMAAMVNKTNSFNGWDYWHYKNKNKKLESIDVLRNKLRG